MDLSRIRVRIGDPEEEIFSVNVVEMSHEPPFNNTGVRTRLAQVGFLFQGHGTSSSGEVEKICPE